MVLSQTATGIKRQVQVASVNLQHTHQDFELAKQRIAELKKQKSHTAAIDQNIRRAKLEFTSAVADLTGLLTSLDAAVKEEGPAVNSLHQQHKQIADITSFMEIKVRKLESDVGHNINHRK